MVTQKTRRGRRFLSRSGRVICIVSLLSFSLSAVAATQGSLGATSTASIDISLVINPMIQVSQVQDIVLSTQQGESSRGNSPLCVSGNYEGEFQLEVRGSGAGSDFELSSGDTFVDYQVSLQDENGEAPLEAMTPSQALPLDDCAVTSRNLRVDVGREDTMLVEPGVYTGTLTLVVAPL